MDIGFTQTCVRHSFAICQLQDLGEIHLLTQQTLIESHGVLGTVPDSLSLNVLLQMGMMAFPDNRHCQD